MRVRTFVPFQAAIAALAISLITSCGDVEDVETVNDLDSGENALCSGSIFGNCDAGTNWLGSSADLKRTSKFALITSEAQVSKLTVYVDGLGATTGSQSMIGVIYKDDGPGGAPGTLLCTTVGVAVGAGTAAAWKDLAITGSCKLAAGSYYLGILTSGPTIGILRYATAPLIGGLHLNSDVYADGPSTSFGARNVTDWNMSIYATYSGPTTDVTPPKPPPMVTATGGAGQITLTWSGATDNVGVHHYAVNRDGVYITSPTTSPLVDAGLAAGQTYSYTVRAVDAAGNISAFSAAAAATTAGTPPPTVNCTYYAAPEGSDSANGSKVSPFASPQRLMNALAPGNTGCLRGGTYSPANLQPPKSGTKASPITLTSYPGERAKLVVTSAVYVPDALSDLAFKNLDFVATSSTQAVMIQDFGERTVWEGNYISGAGLKHCMEIGAVGYGVAHETVIKRNRFHDCGNFAHGNQEHAIYVAQSVSALITENVFRNTAAFAIHLYPDADGTVVTHNIIDGSGYGGIIFASDQYAGTGKVSDNNEFAYNIVTNGARYGLAYFWGPAGQGVGNKAHDNCLFSNGLGDSEGSMQGIALTNNVHADAKFVNRAAGDYRLQPGSPCLSVVGYDAAAKLDF